MASTVTPIVSRGSDPAASSVNQVQQETQFKAKVDAPTTSYFEQATKVSVNATEAAKQRATEKAARKLSDAASFVSVAQYATDEVKGLVDRAKGLAETLKTEVDPTKRARLAQEAASYLQDIDDVKKDATFNGASVVDAGKKQVELSVESSADQNSSDKLVLTVADVRVSRQDLALDSITEADFRNIRNSENEATIEKLEDARVQLTATSADLASAERKIGDIASRYGIESAARADGGPSELDKKAEELAARAAVSLQDQLQTVQNNLDPTRVQELLADDDEDEENKAQTIEQKTAAGPNMANLDLEE